MGFLIRPGMFGARRERVSPDGTVLVVVGTDAQGFQVWQRVPWWMLEPTSGTAGVRPLRRG